LKKKDPWADFFDQRQAISAAMERVKHI